MAVSKQWNLAVMCILIGIAAVAKPAEEPTLEQYCAKNPCRQEVRFQLKLENDKIDESVPLYWPAVREDFVSVLPGDTVYVEATVAGDRLTGLKQVDAIKDPKITMTFEFSQSDDLGMMLTIKNPFPKMLKFHIDMIDFQHKPHQTSSCPVIAGGMAFESWPHPIPELIISELHLLSAEGEMSCVY